MPNNSEIAHLWAAQRRESARGSNLFFEGAVIYSYGRHFPIARMLPDVFVHVGAGTAGPFRTMTACLFTTRGYSNSTAKHMCHVRQAVPDNIYLFSVPDVLADSETAHAANLAAMLADREAAIIAASRARKHGAFELERAESLAESARLYARAFNLPVPDLAPVSPELMAEAKAKADKARKEEADARKERERLAALDYADRVAAWRAGDRRVSLPYRHDAQTMLRLIEDGAVIETSRGARVPVSVAEHLWSAARQARRMGAPYSSSTIWRYQPVGDYTLREIRADGSLVIGCHVLEFAELARMAETLGLPAFDGAGVAP